MLTIPATSTKPETRLTLRRLAATQDTTQGDIIDALVKEMAMQTDTTYSYEPISLSALTATDLIAEINDPEQTRATAYHVTFSTDDHPLGEHAELLWFPIIKRAGIAWGGDAVWTDAQSVKDALDRYLKDDLIP